MRHTWRDLVLQNQFRRDSGFFSSVTGKADPGESASAGWSFAWLSAGLLVIALCLGLFAELNHHAAQVKLKVGSRDYSLLTAATAAAREKGLSGRASLPKNQAMLFIFPAEASQCFWMKDMRFPLDTLWLDAHKKVTATQSNVAADSYPQTFCHDGQYVIELNAGQVRATGLITGQTLRF